MKKQLFNALLFCLLAMPAMSIRADVIDEGQSTEGKDFWVTFMQADQDPNNDLTLSLSISSREDCQVTITNPFSGYTENVVLRQCTVSDRSCRNGRYRKSMLCG